MRILNKSKVTGIETEKDKIVKSIESKGSIISQVGL